ncbi:MAG: flagellar export chaperone FlgN [bacterium]
MSSIAEKLFSAAKEELVLFERLLDLSGQELDCITGKNLDELPAILEEKEALTRAAQESSDRNTPLWPQLEEGDDKTMDDLFEAAEKVREAVEAIQKIEEKIAEIVSTRSKEIQKALGIIAKSGKALNAYKPVRNYAPRFVDRKE